MPWREKMFPSLPLSSSSLMMGEQAVGVTMGYVVVHDALCMQTTSFIHPHAHKTSHT